MGAFTRIPADTFEQIQTDAGILLYEFDVEHPETVKEEDIICPTTGGISAAAEPTYSDMGEDVDNCPANLLELKHLDSWNCHLDFTSLGTSPKSIRLALGAADVDGDNPTHIIPRTNLKVGDAADIWWVGDRADGGMVAVCLKRALSTAGFSLQTTKAGKGQTSVTLTGHVSVDTQAEVPIEFYSAEPTAAAMGQDEGFGEEYGSKKVSDLITPETKIEWKGTKGHVSGKLKEVTSWKEFSTGMKDTKGYYFPVRLPEKYEGKEITVKGKNTKTVADLDWILLVSKGDESTKTNFNFKVGDKEIADLDFSDVELGDGE